MWRDDAPLRAMQFVIEEVLDAPDAWRVMPAFAHLFGAGIVADEREARFAVYVPAIRARRAAFVAAQAARNKKEAL